MTHEHNSPAHGRPRSDKQTPDTRSGVDHTSSCTKVPNHNSAPAHQCTKVPNLPSGDDAVTDLDMTENRVAESEDSVEDINCDEFSSRKLANLGPVSVMQPQPANEEDAKENRMDDDKPPTEKDADETPDAEQFSGQIVYNPDGSALILEECDESLLEQLPTQEGAIVERAGGGGGERGGGDFPPELPRIEQTVYVARRRAWYTAMDTAYRQMVQVHWI